MPTADQARHMTENHDCLIAICDALEAVADSLPHNVDRQQCLWLSRALGPMLFRAQELEEKQVFPMLLGLDQPRPELSGTLERLRLEHQVDLCYAEEVQEMLKAYGEGRQSIAPDTAGFMLRGFFESLRRHIAFEQELLAPLLEAPPEQPTLN
ncbi:hemerythrin domain-containing protein [Devosia albogilva]|uniref:Hemerythrin domain-containing protein n=1 Tax=Devosia albogilva TaxID=429726 RepID=A0ABW5QHR2_9HYPH